MTFHVGQKVVCVDAVDDLVKGQTYTISAIGDFTGKLMCDVAEITNYVDYAWYLWRFRPIVEKKTDISFAQEILRKVTGKNRVRA